MVIQSLRAIYEQGYLRLLDPIDLSEGQEIRLMIIPEQERARVALADMLVVRRVEVDQDELIDEAALFAEVEAEMRNCPSVSDAIIEERRSGP